MPKTYEDVVAEELPLQAHSLKMQGGAPSCVTLFDQFLLCFNLKGQFMSFYRHGGPRQCSRKLDDLKFCWSLKGLSEERRTEMWIKRRAEWWAKRRLEPGKSSEDVWEARPNPYDYPTVDD
ncbi:hypothetical protein BT69DRAFT_1261676 [Atractiella rhizophila]|nr:hypothetical protein BT69DRAFT_1261676 [Atractiella rhizophila]